MSNERSDSSSSYPDDPSSPLRALASFCDQACAAVTTSHAVSDEFIRLAKAHADIEVQSNVQVHEEAINAIASAFKYTLKVQREIRSRLRDAFAPMVTFADGRQYPPLIGDLSESVIYTWTEITAQVDHPGARLKAK